MSQKTKLLLENLTRKNKERISKREVVIVISQLIVFCMVGLIFLKFLTKNAHVFHNINTILTFLIFFLIGGIYLVYRTADKVYDYIYKDKIKREELEMEEFTKEFEKRLSSGEDFDMRDFGKPSKSYTRQFIEVALIFICILVMIWISYVTVFSKL